MCATNEMLSTNMACVGQACQQKTPHFVTHTMVLAVHLPIHNSLLQRAMSLLLKLLCCPVYVCVLCLQAKTRDLKQTLNNEFRLIHELCMFVLANTRKTELLRATLTGVCAAGSPPRAAPQLSREIAGQLEGRGDLAATDKSFARADDQLLWPPSCAWASCGDVRQRGVGCGVSVWLCIAACLSAALAAYLSWVPPGYIFESQLVPALLQLFPQAPFRNVSLQCLTEVRVGLQQVLHLECTPLNWPSMVPTTFPP
jgi:hypothetical protein